VDNEIIMDAADEDTLAVDELGSDVSLDEDAVPARKVTTNNKVSWVNPSGISVTTTDMQPAMRVLTEGIKMTNTPWPEHLIVQSKTIIDVDPSDGELHWSAAFA
jgi:rRNA-processing protein EBP2